jgi:hypothetical protein
MKNPKIHHWKSNLQYSRMAAAVPQTTVPPVPTDGNETIIGTRNLKHEQ